MRHSDCVTWSASSEGRRLPVGLGLGIGESLPQVVQLLAGGLSLLLQLTFQPLHLLGLRLPFSWRSHTHGTIESFCRCLHSERLAVR